MHHAMGIIVSPWQKDKTGQCRTILRNQDAIARPTCASLLFSPVFLPFHPRSAETCKLVSVTHCQLGRKICPSVKAFDRCAAPTIMGPADHIIPGNSSVPQIYNLLSKRYFNGSPSLGHQFFRIPEISKTTTA
jgi:hypothetical protein